MSVAENMGFGLVYRRIAKAEIRRRVAEAARILGIEELLARRPRQLSGGQRQRVAMGRAIVRNPQVFLFDEPLSNLDAKLRVQMRTEMKKLHQRVATTIVYVTHDQVEAMTLADRIVLMRDGRIEQVGTPDELYNRPASTYVAGFIGAPTMNLLPVDLVAAGTGRAIRLDSALVLPLPEAHPATRLGEGARVVLGLRPESLGWQPGDGPALEAPVEVVEPLGSDTLVVLAVAGRELIARLPPHLPVRPGERLKLWPDLDRMHLFDAATGRVLRA
jgi:ABC-type sugar transport system ATPase subunit